MKPFARWQVPVLGLFLLFMVIPILATAMFSISVRWDRTIWPEGFTLDWWDKVTSRPAFARSLSNSLLVALGTVACICGWPPPGPGLNSRLLSRLAYRA